MHTDNSNHFRWCLFFLCKIDGKWLNSTKRIIQLFDLINYYVYLLLFYESCDETSGSCQLYIGQRVTRIICWQLAEAKICVHFHEIPFRPQQHIFLVITRQHKANTCTHNRMRHSHSNNNNNNYNSRDRKSTFWSFYA